MQKKHILIAISIIVLLFSGACGKKGDPLPKGLPVPAAINDLKGQVRDGVLFLSLTVPRKNMDGSELKDLAGFKFFKSCGSCLGAFEPFREVRFDEGKGYTISEDRLYIYDDDLTEGFEYTYKVFPFNTRGVLGNSSNVFSIKWMKPPAPPKNASVEVNDRIVELKWSGEPGLLYNVYRYMDSIYPLFPVNKDPLAKPSFMDSGLENGKTYKYDIRAVSVASGQALEGESLKIEATPKDKTPPRAPVNVRTEKKGKIVAVLWNANKEKDLAGYNVYRIAGGKTAKLNKELLHERTYLDEELPDYRYVSYYVTAVDTSGNESDASRESIIVIKE